MRSDETTCCDESQRIEIRSGIEIAAVFSRENGVPVYLGEFGSSSVADTASRVGDRGRRSAEPPPDAALRR